MKRIKAFIQNKNLDYSGLAKKNRAAFDWTTVKKTAFIGHCKDGMELEQFLKQLDLLEKPFEEVKTIVFCSKIKTEELSIPEGIIVVGKNQKNWYDKPNPDFIDQFLKIPFDLVVNFSKEDHYGVLYALKKCEAKFIVGYHLPYYEEVTDFMLMPKENIETKVFYQTLIQYLKILKSS